MSRFFEAKRRGRPAQKPRTTTISFSAQDLADLGHLVAVGQSVTQKSCPAVPRLKAALTRMGVQLPKGL